MNLASFYLCLFMNIKRFSKATLKCDIMGKDHILSRCIRITLENDLLFPFTFLLQVWFWSIYDTKLKFSFTLGYFV